MALRRKRIAPLGLITNPALGSVVGAFVRATNVRFRRPGVASLRNGAAYTSAAATAHRKLFPYDTGLVGFFADGSLRKRNGSSWTSYSGTYTNVDGNGARLRAVVANANLLVMTGDFMYRLSGISGAIEKAGAPRGLCFDRSGPANVLVTSGGFLADQFQVAYRGQIAKRDAKQNTHYGEPSSRTIIANATFTSGWVTTQSKNVVLRLILAAECTTDHFFQIYRSKQVPVGTQPDDDVQLVYQDYLTTKNISDGYVEITDTFPETVPKGAYINTAPNFANGVGKIDGENGPPPQFMDAVVFKDRLFGFNVAGYPTFQLTILAVGGTDGIQANDVLEILDGAGSIGAQYTAGVSYSLVTTGSTSQNLEQTALNLVQAINKDHSNTLCYAIYASGPSDIPGKIILVGKTPTRSATATSRFQVDVSKISKRTCFDPVLIPGGILNISAGNLVRAGTTVTATVANNLRVGEQVTVSIVTGSFVSGTYTVLTASASAFTYTEGSGAASGSALAFIFRGSGSLPEAIYKAKLDSVTNGFRYSKVREMEAFPLRNTGTVGEASVDIGRAFALKDSIVVLTLQGLFRLSGADPETFSAEILDPTAALIGREAAFLLGEAVYAWTTRGLIEVTDSGWKYLSSDIDPDLAANFLAAPTEAKEDSFIIGSEQQKMLELYLPALGIGYPIGAYCLELATGRWSQRNTLWNVVCATYDPVTRLINYGTDFDGGGSFGYLFIERLTNTVADTMDDMVTNTTGPVTSSTPISYDLKHAPFFGKDPSSWKNWQELAFIFEAVGPGSTYTLNNTSENGTEAITITPTTVADPIVRAWPTFNVQGNRLSVELSGASRQNIAFALIGTEIAWEEFGLQVVR